MKKEVMKRAWEIYRTLEGDRNAKLSQALKQAWAEVKTEATTEIVLPELIGSEKQVAWAESIRKNYVKRMYEYINSDEIKLNEWSPTAEKLAFSIASNGITNSDHLVSLKWELYHEAREKGIYGREADKYVDEHYTYTYKNFSKNRPAYKLKSERLAYDKEYLKEIFEKTLQLETRASDWIKAFKYGVYDNYYKNK